MPDFLVSISAGGGRGRTPCDAKKKKENRSSTYIHTTVPHSKSGIVPMSSLIRRWVVGVLGSWKGWDNWVKGGANRVSLQAT